jgi:hypothetical protein
VFLCSQEGGDELVSALPYPLFRPGHGMDQRFRLS